MYVIKLAESVVTWVLQYFANVVGQRVNNARFESLTLSELFLHG